MEDRIAALETRMAAAEDELAIIRLIAGYGPMVDCGLPGPATALFVEDGVYDIDLGRMDGAQAFHDMLAEPASQARVAQGIAHVMGLPMVTLRGAKATAVNPTFVFMREGDGYGIWRVAQNVWELEKIAGAWKIVHRTNRLVDAGGESRALLERSLSGA